LVGWFFVCGCLGVGVVFGWGGGGGAPWTLNFGSES